MLFLACKQYSQGGEICQAFLISPISITIEDTAGEANTEDAQLGKVMRDIERLPVLSTANGRNVLALAYTQPGTTPAEAGVVSSGIAVNGQRARQNHYVLDGATTNWSTHNAVQGTAGLFHPMPSRNSAWSPVPPRPSTAEVPGGL